ncbi:MAG: hypothetical protein GX025_10085 [Clostridiales bacterium]|nr:hypothetical protein [Clostridiales bacterium]
MAQKRLNNVLPGVKRPLRVEDLQAVWDGLNEALAIGTTGAPRILWGFNDKGDGTLSAGIVAFNEKLYVHEDTADSRINVGATVYAHEVPSGDLRIFADGSEHPFSYNRIVNSIDIGGTAIGTFSIANIDTWKWAYIGAVKIPAENFEDGWLNAYQPFGVIFNVPISDVPSGNTTTATIVTSPGSDAPFFADEVFEPTGVVTFRQDYEMDRGRVEIWVKGGELAADIPRNIAVPTVSVSLLNPARDGLLHSSNQPGFNFEWTYTPLSHISRKLTIYFWNAANSSNEGDLRFAINGWVSRTPYTPGGAV